MKTKTITHDGQGQPLKVTVREATSLDGMKRSLLINEAIAEIRDGQQGEPSDNIEIMARSFLRRYTFPNCLACVLETEGLSLDLDFEEFANLPDVFVGKWEQAALELNSHWQLQASEKDEETEEKKKEPSEPE